MKREKLPPKEMGSSQTKTSVFFTLTAIGSSKENNIWRLLTARISQNILKT